MKDHQPHPFKTPPRNTTFPFQRYTLVFQQHQDEPIYNAWTRFKNLIKRVPYHGLDLWSLTLFFYDHVDDYTRMDLAFAADGNLRELSGEEAWETIENFAQGQKEWDNLPNIISEQEVTNLKAQAKRLFRNEDVWVEMHRNITWDKVENPNPQSTPQVPPSFEETTPSVTHPEEIDETIGIPTEVEPLDETQLEDLGLNTCNHDISLSFSLGNERGPKPPIKPPSPDSFKMKEVDHLTIHTPPSPHVASFHHKDMYCYYHPCISDPKKHYGFKPGKRDCVERIPSGNSLHTTLHVRCSSGILSRRRVLRIKPPRRLKKKSVNRLVEKRVAKAIEEYKKSRANLDSAGSSGGNTGNPGGTMNVQGCSHKTFMNGKPHSFNGTEDVVGLRRWIEKVEQVFEICKCAEEYKVMFAASTFEGHALTWWNGNVHTLGLVNANRIPWTEFKTMMTTKYCPKIEIQKMEQELWTLTLKGDDIEAYNNRFHELVLMCPELVSTEKKKIEKYIRGFPERIKGNIISSKPATLHDAINMARELVEQAVQGRATRIGESNKRKWYTRYCSNTRLIDDKKPVVQKQRRLNLNMQEVVKKEVMKLLDTGTIYPIAIVPLLVSPIHCVPKKGGITVITNKKDELVPTRTVTGWRHCKDAHLVLNWEKYHFMVKEGIVLGHKVSSAGLEVDKAKIDVILKLPPPTNIKGVRNFLGHAGFYRRFIKDFSKIARPLTKLLEKDTSFELNDKCQEAFKLLKEKLTCAPVINVASDHLSRIENDKSSDDSDVDDNFPGETLMEINTKDESWFADFANYLNAQSSNQRPRYFSLKNWKIMKYAQE
ncbi:putative reverse transcriptase domain-containing protein [Tanacetum coccineum]